MNVSPDVEGRLRELVSAKYWNSIPIMIDVHRKKIIALPFQSCDGLVAMECEGSDAFIFTLPLWKNDKLDRLGKREIRIMIGALDLKIWWRRMISQWLVVAFDGPTVQEEIAVAG